MTGVRLGPLPPLGPLSTFPETNVRTYARGPDGRDGLWFLSLEADSGRGTTLASARAGSGAVGPRGLADRAVARLHHRRPPAGRGQRRAPALALHDVDVVVLEQSPVEAAGLPAPQGDPLAGWSPGVRVRLGHPRPV